MTISFDLPSSLIMELSEEADREGISEGEHAMLLLEIAGALHSSGKNRTPFQNAIVAFLAARALDPDEVRNALDELIRFCVSHDNSAAADTNGVSLMQAETPSEVQEVLSRWRSASVHKRLGKTAPAAMTAEWPQNFIDETYGSLSNDPISRLPQGAHEARERIAPLRSTSQ